MTDSSVKTFVKESIETGIEQITGPKPKQQSQQQSQQPQQKKNTAGLSDQISPGKIFKDMLKQGGVDTDKVPTQQEIEKMDQEDQKEAIEKIRKIEEEELGIKTIQPQQSRGNMEVINPPKPKQQEVPEYIKGKPEYNPERQAKMEEEKKKLPELPMPKGKPPRGSWISAMERKKHGAEIKGGRE